MTNTMWELYWLTRIINIHDGSGVVWGILMGALCIFTALTLLTAIDCHEAGEHIRYWMKRVLLIFGIPWLIASVVYTFTPTKEEAAFIVAGGAVVAAAQSDAGQKIAQKSVAVLEGSLDNILGKEAVQKAQIDVEKKVVDAVKNQMGIKDQPASEAAGS
jgi:hypothetical protein